MLKADEPDYDNPPYYRVALLGCGAEKQDEPAEARDLYTSTYFQKKRRWAELYAYRYLIVSAEHVLLEPEDEIEPYDTRLSDLTETGRELWRQRLVDKLSVELSTVYGTPHSHEVVLLMGESYRDAVREALEATARGYFDEDEHAAVWSPFEDVEQARGGQGNQMGWLSDEIERAEKPNGQTDMEAFADGGEA